MDAKTKIISNNKKAYFSYAISDTFLCGIALNGSEIKSIRFGQVNIAESYCILSNDEIWIKNMDIARYQFCNDEDYNPIRLRKLLLKKISCLLILYFFQQADAI